MGRAFKRNSDLIVGSVKGNIGCVSPDSVSIVFETN